MLTVSEIESGRDDLRATQRLFLEAIIDTGSVTGAAKAIGISRDTPYGWLDAEEARGIPVDADPPPKGTFAYALRQAKRLAGEAAAGRVFHHSMESPGMPGVIASIAYAKRYDPLWNDQLRVQHSGAVLHANVDLNKLSPEGRSFILERLQQRLLSAAGEDDVAVDDETAE